MITIGMPYQDAQFLIRQAVYEIRRLLQEVSEGRPELESIVVEGPPGAALNARSTKPKSLSEEIERLADLLERGHIDETEFSELKAKLLAE